MDTNTQPKPQVVDDELSEMPETGFPGVEAYCRALKEQGIEFQIIPMRNNQSSNTKT